MANTFLNATEYANVMLLLLKNNLVMGRLVSGQFKDQVSDENGLKISVKKPPQFIAKDGPLLAEQSIATGSTDISVNRYRNVHFGLSDLEAVSNWNDLMRNQTMRSAASTLAHDVDQYLHSLLLDFASHVGTPGETLKNPQQFMRVHTRLAELGVPLNDLQAVMQYGDAEAIRGNLVNSNIQGVNRDALQRARIPVMSEIDAYATQHITTLVTGTRLQNAGTVAGAAQNRNYVDVKSLDSSTLAVAGLGAGATVKRGELFTIAGVFAVNQRSGQQLDFLRQFVVTQDATADGAGAATLSIYPHIIVANTGGAEADTNTAFQTVSAAPANGALLSFLGAPGARLHNRAAWQKQAIQLVSVRLETPLSDTSSFATDPNTGISIRYWRGSDIATGRHVHRFDMLYGAKVIDPRLGTRFSGDPAT